MPTLFTGPPRYLIVSRDEVRRFNASHPGSLLSPERHYWFEFDADGTLIDHDVPEHSDGPWVVEMVNDCRRCLRDGDEPDWSV